MKVIISKPAASDLEAIGDLIAADNPRRAVSFVRELRRKCLGLGKFPRSAPLLARYESHAVRKLVHANYLILFSTGDSAVHILRILHGATDYERLLYPEAPAEA